ncbi:hypothetical protein [Pyrobaculum ferrireducens]|nr:hypothetical protein [Pyrobaculum ferrireducens]
MPPLHHVALARPQRYLAAGGSEAGLAVVVHDAVFKPRGVRND